MSVTSFSFSIYKYARKNLDSAVYVGSKVTAAFKHKCKVNVRKICSLQIIVTAVHSYLPLKLKLYGYSKFIYAYLYIKYLEELYSSPLLCMERTVHSSLKILLIALK
jgi:hypothetical protein